MGEQLGWIKRGWKFISQPDDEQRAIIVESRPYLIFLTIVLTGMTAIIFSQNPSLQEPPKLIVLTLLLTIHILLHWFSGWSSLDQQLSVGYLVIQGLLSFVIVMYSGQPEIGLGLYAALIGEIIGVFGISILVASAVIAYVLLHLLSIFYIGGFELVNALAPTALSVSTLLVVIMVLIRRSLDSGDRAKELLAELESTHERLAEYASQVETLTLAEERARMARDLHDTLAQGLAGLVMQLEAAHHHLKSGKSERATGIIEQAMGRARSSLSEAREAIEDLRQGSQEDIISLIKQQTQRFSGVTGVPCELFIDFPEDIGIEDEIREHAAMILSESLANIAVHAQATRVVVRFADSQEGFRMDIIDDGIGFIDHPDRRPGHYGIVGMRERARLAGGRLEIDSAVGKGCRISTYLPLSMPSTRRD